MMPELKPCAADTLESAVKYAEQVGRNRKWLQKGTDSYIINRLSAHILCLVAERATSPDGGDSLRQSILETATDEEITQARRAKQERDSEACANVLAALAAKEGG